MSASEPLAPLGDFFPGAHPEKRRQHRHLKALVIKAEGVRGLGDRDVRPAICSVYWVGFSRGGLGRRRVRGEVGMRRKSRKRYGSCDNRPV